MSETRKSKIYDLEERTWIFAKRLRSFIKKLSQRFLHMGDYQQVLRASGSVGANYIEANESLSKKDFVVRIKICRKEAKETQYWLKLIETYGNSEIEKEHTELIQESKELMNIFGAILHKSEMRISKSETILNDRNKENSKRF